MRVVFLQIQMTHFIGNVRGDTMMEVLEYLRYIIDLKFNKGNSTQTNN